jgi:hypothetical protein
MKSGIDLLNQITKKKRGQADLLRYLRDHDIDLHDKLKHCGSWLLLREWIQSGEMRLRNANFCKRHTACESCAVRRGARLAQRAHEKILEVLKEFSNLIPVHCVLTIKNTDEVEAGIVQLKTALSKMTAQRRKSLTNPERNGTIEWCKVAGGVKAIEVTNKGNGWHPHAHHLLLCESYLDLHKLSEEFQRFGGGKIVWAEKVGNGEQDLTGALLEVLKYPTKFSGLSPENLLQFHDGAKGSRLTDTFGNLRGVNIGDIDMDDCEGLEGPWRDWIAQWHYQQMRFTLRDADAPLIIKKPKKVETK